ncbi:DNA helicase [Tanacetum coccineum]
MDDYRIPDDQNGLLNLIRFIYDNHTLQNPTPQELQEKVIICPKNEIVDIVNAKVMSMIPGRPHVYNSYDEALPHGHDGGELLQLGATYRISGFSCEKTPSWEQTLQNDTSLIFGKYLQAHNIANDNFPQHYFDFATYNELADSANVRDAVLTDYIGRIRAISGISTFGDATSQRKQRRTIDIENLREEQSTDTTPFLNINNQRTLKRPDFVLDTIFQNASLPLPAPPTPVQQLPLIQNPILPATQPQNLQNPPPTAPELAAIHIANPPSPALSTTTSNEPEVIEADIGTATIPKTTPRLIKLHQKPRKKQKERTPNNHPPAAEPSEAMKKTKTEDPKTDA